MNLLLVYLVVSWGSSPILARCFHPNTTEAPLDVSCFPDRADSFCCNAGQACMTNGVCKTPAMYTDGIARYQRGSCTDANFLSSACPVFCMGVEATPDNMVPCNVTGQDTFCCGVGCKCDANHEIHTFTAPAQTLTIIGVSSSFPAPTATHAANQSAGVAPASHSAVATLGPGERTVQEAEVATTELALKIGAGLGVPLLVIFISLLVWCFYRRGKKAVLLKQVVEAQKQQAAALEAGEGAQTWGRVHEAPGMPVVFAELPANYKGSEMPVRESLVKESVSRTSTASGERTARSTKGASQSTASGGSVVMVSRGGSRSTASSGTIRIMEMTAPNEDTRINQI